MEEIVQTLLSKVGISQTAIEVFSHLILDDAGGVWQSELHEFESIQ